MIEEKVKLSIVDLKGSNTLSVRTKFLKANSEQFALLNKMHEYFLGIELDEGKYLKLVYSAFQRSKGEVGNN